MRTIDLSSWKQVGEGGNGKTYVNPADPDVILKVSKPALSTKESVTKEYEVSKAVETLGLSAPAMYEIVRVGNAYATLSQVIKGKKSLSRICHDSPERLEEMAVLLSTEGKKMFSTPCDTAFFPSRKQQLLTVLCESKFVNGEIRDKLLDYAVSIPEDGHCVHGDFQPGNIITAGGNCYWIDLDRFGYGDPMFDIGHLFLVCNVHSKMKRTQDIFHMDEDQLRHFWDAFAKAYTGGEDHSAFDATAGKFACLDIVLRNCFTPPSFLEKIFLKVTLKKIVKQYFK